MRNFLVKVLHLHGIHRVFNFWLVNHVYAGDAKEKYYEKKRKLLIAVDVELGEGTKVVGPIFCHGNLKVGKNTFLGKNLMINGNGTVVIGDNCDLGPEITFQTGGHKIGNADRRAGEGVIFNQFVGNGTWIGGRVTVLNNTTIGNGCVIGGGAVVTKDVEDNSLSVGIPAKTIRRLDS